jgi:methylmalonyl-CoA mutase N-terminal domain/subunit
MTNREENTKKGPSERKEEFKTSSGLPVKTVYGPGDVHDVDVKDDLGEPGSYPFTRGIHSNMYRGRFWTMRQYAGFGSAKQTNERFRYLLEQGQTGLSVAFDLPTQMGYDSDHPLSMGEVGKTGVAIDSLADLEVLFDRIPLDQVSTSMTINATAAVLLAMYITVAEKQGVSPDVLRGTVQNDILKEYIARGTYIYPPGPSMRITTDLFAYCAEHLPRWNAISVSGYHIREAGSTAAQEMAFTLADAIAYMEAAKEVGLDVERFASRLSFFFGSHSNFLEEVAKFRAGRKLWARIVRERFGVTGERAMMMRFHTQTAGCTLTAQQFENNAIRVAFQALAAALGGTQSLHTNSRDEALSLPTEDSVRLALRTQQIIAYETGIADTVDPLGGSYFIETLTKRLEEEIDALLGKIDGMGGATKAVESGYFQREIQRSAYEQQKAVESGDTVVVGVNRFTMAEEDRGVELLRVDPKVQDEQLGSLAELKRTRDNGIVSKRLVELKETAEGDANLVSVILDCVRAYCTLGEICDVLRGVFGEYKEQITL